MRIVFMGTPVFARTVLERLLSDGHTVVGVFTQPDKPRNRGKVTPSPVKECAEAHGIPVYQPMKMRDGTALADLRALEPEAVIVAAYGRILPEEILAVPPLGCINVHASLLPKYRGAAPINCAILNGETETGVTIMYMAKECDTGDMILSRSIPLGADVNAEELFLQLADLGAEALSEALRRIEAGTATRTKQDDALATFAPMLTREMSPIDWTRPAETVFNQIRALADWPCATTVLDGKTLKVFRAVRGGKSAAQPGKMRAEKQGIEVTCGDGNTVILTEVQTEGGRRMPASAYLNGRRIAVHSELN